MFRLYRILRRQLDLDLFLLGFVVGVLLALLQHHVEPDMASPKSTPITDLGQNYLSWLNISLGLTNVALDADQSRYDQNSSFRRESELLHGIATISCLIFEPENAERAKAISNTWGQHCNNIAFFSHKFSNESVNVQRLESKSSFELLCKALNKMEKAENKWIFISDDRTFAIMENLRRLIAALDPNEPYYLGHAMTFWSQNYNWMEAGIVLSKNTIRLFLEIFDSDKKCEEGGKHWNNADWYLGKHLQKINISVKDTRDDMGRSRFHGLGLNRLLFTGGVSSFDRFWRDSLYISKEGLECCADDAITIHPVTSTSKFYQLEYLVQHLRAFPQGGQYGNGPREDMSNAVFMTNEERRKFEMWQGREKILDEQTLKEMLRAEG